MKNKIKKGKIVKTDPAIGRYVKEGSKITLYRSKGEKTYKIEDYTGKNYIEIQTLLENVYKLEVTVEKRATDDGTKYDKQQIIGQSLAVGSEVKKGDSIILYIPDLVEEYPNMIGWTQADVEAFCTKYGITLEIKEQETDAYDSGKVFTQSRSQGTPLSKGDKLTVTIAVKPKEVKPKEPTNNNSNNNSGTTSSETTKEEGEDTES